MRPPMRLSLAFLSLFAASSGAHFNMLLPQKASAKKGEALTLTYQWGHPFEHQLFDAPHPQSLIVLAPDGKKTAFTDKLAKTTRPAGAKEVTAYQLRFTPRQRGDYVFVLQTPAIWMEEDGEFLQDTVKVVLHVQVQKGWDARSREELEFVPLTRPYGLRPGMVFQTRIVAGSVMPLADSLVEVERYNAAPPKELPPDEHITPHRQNRHKRRRHDYADRAGLVVPHHGPRRGKARERRQDLSPSPALHLLGLRG